MGVLIFRRQQLECDEGGTVFPEVSQGIAIGGFNAVRVALSIIEVSAAEGVPEVFVTIEGSNDMQKWVDTGFSMSSTSGASQASAADIGTTYIRCKAWVQCVDGGGGPQPASAIIAVELHMFDSAA